jgi:hypothetical protein
MGYCYDAGGRLVCDGCGRSVTEGAKAVRKRRCPFGWCQAPAMCAACATEHAKALSKDAHRERGCERHAMASIEADQTREALLAAGEYLLVSGLGIGTGDDYIVHAIFKGAGGRAMAAWVPANVYQRRHPFMQPTTFREMEQWAGVRLPAGSVRHPVYNAPETLLLARAAWRAIREQGYLDVVRA